MKRLLALFGLLFCLAGPPVALAQTTYDPATVTGTTILTNGNLTATSTTGGSGVRSTTNHASGKYYGEWTVTAKGVSTLQFGLANGSWAIVANPGFADANSVGYWSSGSIRANSNGTNVSASAFTTGNTVSWAVDIPNHLVYFALNCAWQNSANPGAGTGGINYITTSPMYAIRVTSGTSTEVDTIDFGNTAFACTPPSGFIGWDAVAATGGSSLSLLGVGH